MTRLEHEIKEWKEKYFIAADKEWHFRKLCEEVGELGEALMRGNKTEINMEMGDVGVVLAGLGISMNESLAAWMATVMDKNRERTDKSHHSDLVTTKFLKNIMKKGRGE